MPHIVEPVTVNAMIRGAQFWFPTAKANFFALEGLSQLAYNPRRSGYRTLISSYEGVLLRWYDGRNNLSQR